MLFIKSYISGSFIVDYIMLKKIFSNKVFLLQTGLEDAFFIRFFYYFYKKNYVQDWLFLYSQK